MNKLILVGIVIVAVVGFSVLTYAGYVPGLSEFFQPEQNPNNENQQIFKVTTGHMAPEIKSGALVTCESVDFESLEVGDIIVFQFSNQSMVYISRISEITSDGLKTTSDNNLYPDSWTVTPQFFIGKVVAINNP